MAIPTDGITSQLLREMVRIEEEKRKYDAEAAMAAKMCEMEKLSNQSNQTASQPVKPKTRTPTAPSFVGKSDLLFDGAGGFIDKSGQTLVLDPQSGALVKSGEGDRPKSAS